MSTAQITEQESILQPGADSEVHDQNLHQGVAAELSVALKQDVQSKDVQPATIQDGRWENIKEIGNSLDPFVPAFPRTTPSASPLRMVWERMRKKNPNVEITERKAA